MSRLFEEIDSKDSELGEISLRRRRIPALGNRDIYEVRLGDEFLMSSMFVEAEVALADYGLAAVAGENLRVVVGGLGLGHTAEAALRNEHVSELLIVEVLDTVIGWHQDEKLPLGKALNDDPRCRYIHASFFDRAVSPEGFDPENPGPLDAILLDIDHSPNAYLNSANASFYQADALQRMSAHLRPGGVFAMWSTEGKDEAFMALLGEVFGDVKARLVTFYNPFQNREEVNTVYIARTIDNMNRA